MTVNHLPENRDLAAMGQPQFAETTMEGIGFGLGFAVLLDPTAAQVIGTPGEFYWGGMASTAFFISPDEDMTVLFLTQLVPSGSHPSDDSSGLRLMVQSQTENLILYC